jgi:polyferredoxin
LRTIRRIFAGFFFLLFLFLLVVCDSRRLAGWDVALLLELDPLTAVASLLTSGTLFRGLAWSLVIILPTLIFGRFFCSWICPLGILNQWLSHLFNKRQLAEEHKLNRYRPIFRAKYYLLLALLVLAVFGCLQTGLFDPIALITRSFVAGVLPGANLVGAPLFPEQPLFHGGVLIAFIFLVLLFANRFLTRFWCRVLCPLGALLGLLSTRALLRIRRDVDRCTDCGKCLQYCQGACDPDQELRVSECHLCLNCIEQCDDGALHFGLPGARSSVHRSVDLDRRRLVETAVATVVLYPLLRSSVSAASTPHPQVIRPPGSIAEEDFLKRCIKCATCMNVCPTNGLQPALLEGGFEALWTPILDNRIGYCAHHCVLCGQVCPTGAIRPISEAEKLGTEPFSEPVKLGTAFFDRGRCLPWAMNTSCIVCEEVCPTSPKAIWFETVEVRDRDGSRHTLKRPQVDPKLCIGCGICENKCPVTDRAAIRVTSVGERRSPGNRMILNRRQSLPEGDRPLGGSL